MGRLNTGLLLGALLFLPLAGCEKDGNGTPACVESECVGSCVLQGHTGGHCEGDMCVCTDEDASTDPGTDPGGDPGVDPGVDPGPDADPLTDLDVTVAYPARITSAGGVFFPTYLAHLIGLPAFESGGWHFAEVSVTNTSTTSSYQVRASATLPGYATEAERLETVGPSTTVTIALDPTLDLDALYALSAPVAGSMSVSVEVDGGPSLYSGSEAVNVLPKNTVIWDAMVEGYNGDELSVVMATPHDSGRYVEFLVADAADISMWGSLGGYQTGFMVTTESFSVDVGYVTSFFMLLEVGEVLDGSLTLVDGGLDDDIDVAIMNQTDYTTWMSGGSVVPCFYGADSVTGAEYSCTAPSKDWYYLSFYNTTDNYVARDITTRRYVSKEEVSRRHMEALFYRMHDMGTNYTSVAGDFFIGTQYVRLPSETISGISGNCIDGTLVFASALESLGMRPVLVYVPGHAFFGVYTWDDTSTIIPLETTMVSGGDFAAAYFEGWDELVEYTDAGTATFIDVQTLRMDGLLSITD